ncbi:hypothetical protein [Pseudomonas sp. MWU318]|uniref:hypothetical protein n=1 Tax=Pseudomonas sp. MWU318 TaxID=2802569 RepID=UPI0019293F6D|nr:hypothetical protein [Pseudomonas sp. MWU318]
MFLHDRFCEFRSRSFYLDGERVCDVLVFFFRLESCGWVSMSIGEGVAVFSTELPKSEFQLNGVVGGDVDYPVLNLDILDSYVGRKIMNIYEYRIKDVAEGCVGMYFDCGAGGFSVLECDGCLSFFNDVRDLGVEVSLVKLSL